MKKSEYKILVKKTMEDTIINQWLKPRGFDLSVVCLNDRSLKLSLNVCFGSLNEFKRFIKEKYEQDITATNSIALYYGFETKGVEWHFINIQKNDWTASDYGVLVIYQ